MKRLALAAAVFALAACAKAEDTPMDDSAAAPAMAPAPADSAAPADSVVIDTTVKPDTGGM
jgi:uncharacterized lipoprotein YajG